MTIDASQYGGLGKYSDTSQKREPGVFKSCFITGEPREMQDVGKLQLMLDFDSNTYLENNSSLIHFVPLFITRFREKTIRNDKGHVSTMCFSWSGETGETSASGRTCPASADRPTANGGWCKDCKFTYLIAGLYLTDKMKSVEIPKKPEEPDGEKIKALVYFKCQGVKFGSAMNFVNLLSEKGKDLKPLSNDPDFEKRVVTPKRYMCTAGVGTVKTDYGNKFVFKFDTKQLLPDSMVEQLMNYANDLIIPFEKQFDKSEWVTGSPKSESGVVGDSEPKGDTSTVSFEDESDSSDESEGSVEMPPEELDFGL